MSDCVHPATMIATGPHGWTCTECGHGEPWMGPLYDADETFEGTFSSIFGEAFDLLVERQKKYGPKNVESLGLFGVFGRLSDDKVERIRRSLNGKVEHGHIVLDPVEDFADESFEDALFDIANYALIMIALKRGAWGRPLAEDFYAAQELVEALSGGPVLNFEEEQTKTVIDDTSMTIKQKLEAIGYRFKEDDPGPNILKMDTAVECADCGQEVFLTACGCDL